MIPWRSAIAVLVLSGGMVCGQSPLGITNVAWTTAGEFRINGSAPAGTVCRLQYAADLMGSFTNVIGSGQPSDVDGAVTWLVPPEASPAFYRMSGTLEKQRLTWSDVEAGLTGTFAIPLAAEGDLRFGYASGVHAQLTNGNLLVVGHPYYDAQAEVALPAVLDGREGTRVGGWIDITQGLLPAGWAGGPACYVGGMLEVEDRIYFTKYQWYNGSGTDWQSQGYYQGAYDGSGTASGLWAVENPYAHHSRVGGYLSYPPHALQQDYAYLAGLEGTSGAALGRWGPNLFAVDPTPTNDVVRAATLICHDSEPHEAPDVAASNATSSWWVANAPTNQQWWIANKVTDVQWIETATRHGVICLVYRGLGRTWYGLSDGGSGLPDPYGGGSGYHAEGWALQAWIYDPQDLLEVYRGERDPWSLAPVEAVLLTERLPGVAGETYYSFFTGPARADFRMSVRDSRLILLQENGHPANEWENTPKGYVIQVP